MNLKLALITSAVMAPALALAQPPAIQDIGVPSPPKRKAQKTERPDSEWTTNMDDPPIGNPDAPVGGVLRMPISSYPDTFRLYGPNSNGMIANWHRPFSLQQIGELNTSTLVTIHPNTGNWIPLLATHWKISDDNKSVSYKLDKRVKWSDGQPVTADDYVFAYEFALDERVRDPFLLENTKSTIKSVEKIDDYTIKITGQKASWRPLFDFNAYPIPEHTTELSDTWVEDVNYQPPVTPGPYKISEWETNNFVTYSRVQNWWGDGHHYLQGLFNPEKVRLDVAQTRDLQFDMFKKGELDYLEITTARTWAEEMDFEALNKGWAKAVILYVENAEGMYGIGMNVNRPPLNDENFRKGLQHLFNFEALNNELMYNAYFKKVSAFHGTEYQNKSLTGYDFNPKKAREYFEKAGYTKRDSAGYLVNADGERASVTLNYPSKGLERHLTVLQNFYKRGGVEFNLRFLEGSTHFNRIREKASDMFLVGMTGGYYPSPYQYFHTDFKDKPQTNNFWDWGNETVDELIDIYRFNMDKNDRLSAMATLDSMIHDAAFFIHFWYAPYIRMVHYDHVKFPENYYPRRTSNFTNWPTLWIDTERQKAVETAMEAGESLGQSSEIVTLDPYNIKSRLDAK